MRLLRGVTVGLVSTVVAGMAACAGDSFEAVPTGKAGAGGLAGSSSGGSGGVSGSSVDPGTAGAAGTIASGAGGVGPAGSAGATSGGAAGSVLQGGTGGTDPQGGAAGTSAGAAGADAGGAAGAGTGGAAGAGAGGAAGAGAGGAAGAGAGGSAGVGGAAGGSAGKGGSAGAGGTGGMMPLSCASTACPSGQGLYCNRDTKLCASCTDLSRVVVGTPVAVLGPNKPFGPAYYPRVAEVGPDTFLLTYRLGEPTEGELRVVRANGEAFVGALDQALPPPFSLPTAGDSALVVLPAQITGAFFGAANDGMDDPAFRYALFDSDRKDMVTGTRNLFIGRLPSPSNPGAGLAEPLSADANGEPGKEGDDFGPSYSAITKRLYWMRTRKGGAGPEFSVMTRAVGEAGSAVALELPKGLCVAPAVPIGPNYGPWVTPDGAHVFFHQSCGNAGAKTSGSAIFVLDLNVAGTKYVGLPRRVDTSGGVPAVADGFHRTPSLSPDQCKLYFERESQLMVAPRE